jgi:hypothetical protein
MALQPVVLIVTPEAEAPEALGFDLIPIMAEVVAVLAAITATAAQPAAATEAPALEALEAAALRVII